MVFGSDITCRSDIKVAYTFVQRVPAITGHGHIRIEAQFKLDQSINTRKSRPCANFSSNQNVWHSQFENVSHTNFIDLH